MRRFKEPPPPGFWSKIIKLAQVEVTDPTLKRKGELLSLYIALIFGIIIYTVINNILYLVFYPSVEYTIYLVQEIVLAVLFLAFWYWNRKGHVQVVGVLSTSLTIILAMFFGTPHYIEYIMVVFTIPIGISSFILRPHYSIYFAILTTASFAILSYLTGYVWEYNLTAVIALFGLALLTWVISLQLENVIQKNDKLVGDVRTAYHELKDAYETTLEGWSHALEIRDRETQGHSRRVTNLTNRIAKRMGFTDEQLIHVYRGALLHDIGKLGIPDDILHKPGPLTEQEMNVMKLHPQIAVDLISPIEYLKPAMNIPRYHHEKWDGTGYPYGLSGEAIPLEARIYAVVDVFDALTHDRPYRTKMSQEEAVDYIKSEAGKHFDPNVLEVFLKEIQHAD